MYISPIEHFISWLAPLECAICKHEGNMLCESCRPNIYNETESRCYKCNKLTMQNTVCSSCKSSSALRRLWWADNYEKLTKQLISTMKFKRGRAYAQAYGELLAELLPYLPSDTLVTSVPTATKRIRSRGFDQAALLAKSFAHARGFTYKKLLSRTDQSDQIGKNRLERMRHISKKLLLVPGDISNKTILILDDVLTTGASMEASAKLLRKAGVKHVDGAVIARHLLK